MNIFDENGYITAQIGVLGDQHVFVLMILGYGSDLDKIASFYGLKENEIRKIGDSAEYIVNVPTNRLQEFLKSKDMSLRSVYRILKKDDVIMLSDSGITSVSAQENLYCQLMRKIAGDIIEAEKQETIDQKKIEAQNLSSEKYTKYISPKVVREQKALIEAALTYQSKK